MEWRFAIQEPVGRNRYIPLPPEVRQVVTDDHPLDGESLYWHYERHSNFVLLSRDPLTQPNYVDVGRYKVYDANDDGDYARIRPPDSLDAVVRSVFVPDGRVTYLAHDEMLGESPAVYLLSEGQLLGVLPDIDEDTVTDPDEIASALLRTPGFMPA